jgi:diaminopimelate epimerase
MKRIVFHKYHALGNDFLVLDIRGKRTTGLNFGKLAESICARNTGVGADGILVLQKSRRYDCFVDLYNSDGSWAEKSGNGLRIIASYLNSLDRRRRNIVIETKEDIAGAKIIKSSQGIYQVRVSLGRPVFNSRQVPIKAKGKYHINRPIKIEGKEFVLTAVSVGNPHAVIFVQDFDFDWRYLGSVIETAGVFPHRTNVEFVKIINRSRIVLNDWERGAGDTGSSGTGAGASVAAGVINGFLNRRVEVVFPLGSLQVEWSQSDDNIYLTGPVEFICRGEYQLS